jgi:hypothetical protein
VKSTDANQPGFRVSKKHGTGSGSMGRGNMRFDDMKIEGGENMGAILINAIGQTHGVGSLTANRTQFIAGGSTTNPCVVFSAFGWGTPDEDASLSRADVFFDRVVVRGGDVGVRVCAKTGGTPGAGDSIYDIRNSAFVNNGRYGLMAKGNNYQTWLFNCDVHLQNVTFSGCDTAIWLGDAADGSGTFNTLWMTNVLVYLNNPTGVVLRCEEEDAARASRVYADYSAFFGYGSITNGTDYIELTAWGSHQVEAPAGNPGLAADGYHLVAGVSDARLFSAGAAVLTYDIDGEARPQDGGHEIGADEIAAGGIGAAGGTLLIIR